VKAQKDADTVALERQLSEVLGLKVEIANKGRAGGALTVRYKTLEQLDDVCSRLVKAP
jgi:ParB family chromosome partitioning protein